MEWHSSRCALAFVSKKNRAADVVKEGTGDPCLLDGTTNVGASSKNFSDQPIISFGIIINIIDDSVIVDRTPIKRENANRCPSGSATCDM